MIIQISVVFYYNEWKTPKSSTSTNEIMCNVSIAIAKTGRSEQFTGAHFILNHVISTSIVRVLEVV